MSQRPSIDLRGDEALLADEGSVLLHYALGRAPDQEMVALYVQAVAMTAGPLTTVELPRLARAFPRLLRLFEPVRKAKSGVEHPLTSRLRLASRIANIGYAPRFYDYQGTGFFRCVIGLAWVGLIEVMLLPVRWCLGMRWRI